MPGSDVEVFWRKSQGFLPSSSLSPQGQWASLAASAFLAATKPSVGPQLALWPTRCNVLPVVLFVVLPVSFVIFPVVSPALRFLHAFLCSHPANYPFKVLGYDLPFDRHDWIVSRNGKEVSLIL